MLEMGSGDDKLLFFAILQYRKTPRDVMLNILCDIINDVIDKHVYVWWIWLLGQSDSFGNDWLRLMQRMVHILINVLGAIDMLIEIFSMHMVYTL